MRLATCVTLTAALVSPAVLRSADPPRDAPATRPAASAPAADGYVSSAAWRAWLYHKPGGSEFTVVGDVTVASAAHEPTLTFDRVERSEPPVLVLKLTVERRGDAGAAVLTKKEAKYTAAAHPDVLRARILLPDGKEERIDQIVQTQ